MSEDKKEIELADAILKLRSKDEILEFINGILSNKEVQNISNRWEIVKLLSQNKAYLDIQRQTGASSATVAKISDALKSNSSFKKILDRS